MIELLLEAKDLAQRELSREEQPTASLEKGGSTKPWAVTMTS